VVEDGPGAWKEVKRDCCRVLIRMLLNSVIVWGVGNVGVCSTWIFVLLLFSEETLYFEEMWRRFTRSNLCGLECEVLSEASETFRTFYKLKDE